MHQSKSCFFNCTETLKEFREAVVSNEDIKAQIDQVRADVESFASQFPMPGLDDR